MESAGNNFLPLRDGGVAFTAFRDTSRRNLHFVGRLDSAFTKRWIRYLPAQRSQEFEASQVRELPDGTLQVLGRDQTPATPYLYLLTLDSNTGQVLRQQEFHLPQFRLQKVSDWQLLPDSSIVVAGTAISATAPPASFSKAWVGRYKLTRRPLATVSGQPGSRALLVYPNPADAAREAWAELPAGTGMGGTVVLLDALSRTVRTVAVSATGARQRVVLPLAGLAPGLYLVRYSSPDGHRYHARLQVQ